MRKSTLRCLEIVRIAVISGSDNEFAAIGTYPNFSVRVAVD